MHVHQNPGMEQAVCPDHADAESILIWHTLPSPCTSKILLWQISWDATTFTSYRVSPRLRPCQSYLPPGRKALLCPCVELGSAGSLSSAGNYPPFASLGAMLLPQEAYKCRGRLLGPTPIAGKHSECFLAVFYIY